MEINTLKKLLSNTNDIKATIAAFKQGWVDLGYEDRIKEYEPENHAIFDKQKRPVRKVVSDVPQEDGTKKLETTYEERNRIAFAAQKLIVGRRVMFMTGAGVELESNPQEGPEQTLYDMLIKVAEDNKLDFKYAPSANYMLSEGECVFLCYMEATEKGYWGELAPDAALKIKVMLRSPSLGDTFYPIWDQTRNMVAFGISYKVKDDKDKENEWFDLYTDTEIYKYRQKGTEWILEEGVPIPGLPGGSRLHGFKKIPISFASSKRKEWQDVQWAIERLEELLSNHGETNDAFGNPILLAKGKIQSFMHRKDTAKVLELEGPDTDAKFISWDNAPESIKLEIENLLNVIIFPVSRTPNIAFENVLKVGNIATATLKLMFLDAHAAAKEHQDGTWGESVQRMFNILKSGIVRVNPALKAAANLPVKVKFATYLPKNETEELTNMQTLINTLMGAVAQNLLSLETALKMLLQKGIEIDVEEEMKKIAEQKAESQVTLEL